MQNGSGPTSEPTGAAAVAAHPYEQRVAEIMESGREQLARIESETGTPQFLIVGELSMHTCILAGRVLRRMGEVPKLDVIIESPGGDLEAAAKLSKMLRVHCPTFTAVVPFYAKSAATLLVIGAKKILIGAYGEVGPMDPQVRDPQSGAGFIPSHSIQQTLKFIEETNDPLVKLALTDKLSPLLIGAFREMERATKQEVEEFCQHLPDPARAVHQLTSYYLSHGYPLTGDALQALGFPVQQLSLKESEPYMRLHDVYVALSHLHEHTEDHDCVTPILAQSKNYQVAILDEKVICARLDAPVAAPALSPPASPPPVGPSGPPR